MARRPLHLRWIYVQNHARVFFALAAVTALALTGAIIFLSDPGRGLAIGAIPVASGGIAWILTHRAGYPDRDPNSLPHERLEAAAGIAEPPEWDPFAGERTQAPADPVEQPQLPIGDAAQAGSRPSTTEPGPSRAPASAREEPLRHRPWDDEPAADGTAATVSESTSPAGRESDAPAPVPAKAATRGAPTTDRPNGPRRAPDGSHSKPSIPSGEQGTSARTRKERARGAQTARDEAARPSATPDGVGTDAADTAADTPVGPPLTPLTPAEAAVQAAQAPKSTRRRTQS